MKPEQILVMARGVISSCYPAAAELLAFAQLVRNAALEEAADVLYGNGLEMSLLHDLREEIRSLKS